MNTNFNWDALEACGSASGVPKSIDNLFLLDDYDDLESEYWRIDNVVVVQGVLYESALPTVILLLEKFSHTYETNFPGKEYIIQLIEQIACGKDPYGKNKNYRKDCLSHIKQYSYIFYALIDNKNSIIRSCCLFILGNICLFEFDLSFYSNFISIISRLCEYYDDFNRLFNLKSGLIYDINTFYTIEK